MSALAAADDIDNSRIMSILPAGTVYAMLRARVCPIVIAGINKVKSFPLFIKSESLDLLDEIKNYKWKTDHDGNTMFVHFLLKLGETGARPR